MSRKPPHIVVTVGSGIRYEGADMGLADNVYNTLRAREKAPVRLTVDGTHRRGPMPEPPKPLAKKPAAGPAAKS